MKGHEAPDNVLARHWPSKMAKRITKTQKQTAAAPLFLSLFFLLCLEASFNI